MKVAVCIPIHGDAKAGFAVSLAAMTYHTGKVRPDIDLEIFLVSTTLVIARSRLVVLAREWGAEHILFLDADQTFPPDTLVRLLERGLPMVAGNYPRRVEPHGPVCERLDGSPMVMGKGIEEARSVGFGVCLINARLFDGLKEPWFATPYLENGRFMGEDVYFCGLVRDAGGQIFVDHDIIVGHVGEREYTRNDMIENAARLAFRRARAG